MASTPSVLRRSFGASLTGRIGMMGSRTARCPPPANAIGCLRTSQRSIVDAEVSGQITQVNNAHWMSILQGRERQLLTHVVSTAEEGNVASVMAAMDVFWSQVFSMKGTDSWKVRSDVLEDVMTKNKPARCLEIGTYCGYSALAIAQHLPENGLLVTIDVDPLFSAIAAKVVEHAGLSSKVKCLSGNVETKSARIAQALGIDKMKSSETNPVDFVLCDHSKERYVPDLELLAKCNVVGPGTVVMGDTTEYPGDVSPSGKEDLLAYFAQNPKYRVQTHVNIKEASGITVSEWIHLP